VARVVAFHAENRAHLEPWSPPRPDGFYSEAFWRARLEVARDEFARGTAVRLVFVRGGRPGPIVGECNFTQIVRGPFQACSLGYAIDRRTEGRGLMAEALRAAIAYLFDDWRLHRIQANYRPENTRSGRLLDRLGFVVEGTARAYLFIDGAWRDHVLTSLTNPSLAAPEIV
jgi:ribosomal-protein-alanine N-acetyltransferase